MTDPLTTAAGIAGVIALAGSVCKSFYQFFESIHDAPAVARDLASGLYALNAALSHIQGTLLDRRYVANVQDDQLKAWQECLADCTAAYLSVEERINDSGLASAKQSVPRKTWKSVKAFFTEKQMQDCLRSLESSKTTLLLISGNLQAGLIAEILSQLRETNLSVQKTHRKVRVIFQNVLRPGNSRAPGEKGSIETSSVRLSDAYTENEMEYLLHSSDSVLSPRLRELEENSVGVIWEPESESTIPLRRVISESQSENLAPDIVQGDFQSQIRLEPLPSEISSTSSRDRQIPESQAALERQFKLLLEDRSLILDIESVGRLVLKMQAAARERESKLPHEFGLAQIVSAFQHSKGIGSDNMLFAIASVTQMFFDQVEDIQDLVNAFVTVRHHWFGPDNADEHVRSAFSVIRRAGVEYRRWLEDLHKGDRAQIIIGLILPTPGNKARLERLRAKLVRCVEAAKDAQASFASRKAFEMQCEQLSLQKTINGNLDMLLPYQMTEISHIRAQQAVLPITAGEQPCEVAGSSKKWKHIWKKT